MPVPAVPDISLTSRSRVPRTRAVAGEPGLTAGVRVAYGVAMAAYTDLEVGDRTVRISNPGPGLLPGARRDQAGPGAGTTCRVGDGIVSALRERPVHAAPLPRRASTGEKVHQKRLPRGRAATGWRRCGCTFPRYNRHADELCVTELASVIWAVQMSTVEFHPWNSRRADTEKPDEWRIDLDPMPECAFGTRAAGRPRGHEVLDELAPSAGRRPRAARACTSTSGSSRGWGFGDVRRAALAFAREVERRAPDDVTTTWWRKDRDPAKLFVDYNQNARDHTIASAYSVRGVPEATVSTPITLGRGRRRRAGRLHHRHRARPLRASSATCTPESTTRPSPSSRCWSGPTGTARTISRTPPRRPRGPAPPPPGSRSCRGRAAPWPPWQPR